MKEKFMKTVVFVIFFQMLSHIFSGVDADAKVTWLKDGKPVELDEFVYLKKEGDKQVLCISNATTDDVGEYTCVVENKSGKVQTSANLSVSEMPDASISKQEAAMMSALKIEESSIESCLENEADNDKVKELKKKKVVEIRKSKEKLKNLHTTNNCSVKDAGDSNMNAQIKKIQQLKSIDDVSFSPFNDKDSSNKLASVAMPIPTSKHFPSDASQPISSKAMSTDSLNLASLNDTTNFTSSPSKNTFVKFIYFMAFFHFYHALSSLDSSFHTHTQNRFSFYNKSRCS